MALRLVFSLCYVAFISTSTLAQPKADQTIWLFPSDTALLNAAQFGFVRKDYIPLSKVYERAEASLAVTELKTGCREKVELVKVAGPITLAALRGQIAQKQGANAPVTDLVLESRGEVLLSVEFFSRAQGEETQATLWQGGREYQPVNEHVIQVTQVDCDVHCTPTKVLSCAGGQKRYRVQQWFILRFDSKTADPDWSKSFTLRIRRGNGETEEHEVALGVALAQQAKELN